jgi:hypothetical protein
VVHGGNGRASGLERRAEPESGLGVNDDSNLEDQGDSPTHP